MRSLTVAIVVGAVITAALSPPASAAQFEVWLSTRNDSAANGSVYRLDSSGTQLGSFALGAGEHGGLLQLDSAGNVYTGRYETVPGKVFRHTSTGAAVGGEISDVVYPGVSGSGIGGMWLNGQYLYIGDYTQSPSLRIIDVTTKTETGGSFSTPLPAGGALDVELGQDGYLYVASTNNRIYRYSGSNASWTLDTGFYFGDGRIGIAQFLEGIAVDASGNIYASQFNTGVGKIYKYTNGIIGTPLLIDVFADWGLRPIGLEIGPDNKLYIGTYAAAGTNKILRYNLDGTKDATLATPGLFASGYDFAEQIDFKILPVPEPTSMAAIAVCTTLFVRRRRDVRTAALGAT
jgi:hypothetical protein